jgi:hypothetical protein
MSSECPDPFSNKDCSSAEAESPLGHALATDAQSELQVLAAGMHHETELKTVFNRLNRWLSSWPGRF